MNQDILFVRKFFFPCKQGALELCGKSLHFVLSACYHRENVDFHREQPRAKKKQPLVALQRKMIKRAACK